MINAVDLKKNDVVKFEGALCFVDDVENTVIGGRAGAVTKVRLKDLKSGAVHDKTCNKDDKFEDIDLEKRKAEFLYKNGDTCVFMDSESYEQFEFTGGQLGKGAELLFEGLSVYALFEDGQCVTVQLPVTITIGIKSTMPPSKGDQSSNTGKHAELVNGTDILVPMFVKDGDLVKVDTVTGLYLERVQEKKK